MYLVLANDDPICSKLEKEPELLVEYELYKRFYPTKCVYRLDKANNDYEKDHIHVYFDKKHNNQLYAICVDGTTHDGSKFKLSQKHQEALRLLGIPVPPNGILEWRTLDSDGRMLLCD